MFFGMRLGIPRWHWSAEGSDTPTDDGPIPSLPPHRSIEPGALLGFHAPYLDIPESSYTAKNVAEAYTAAVLEIARFIAIADHLYVPTAELPKLLKPTRDDLYRVDHVDAVRILGIDYIDPTLFRDFKGYTRSMILNACINNYYHRRRRSSLGGYATAASVRDDFIEGSKLLENGEEKLAFGIRRMKQGTVSTWLAFTPIAMTQDGRAFVWCLFSPSPGVKTTFYKPAGTVAELFSELEGKNIVEFSQSGTTLTVGHEGAETWIEVLDMVPPDTKLTDVGSRIAQYQAAEEVFSAR
jgi:hypothetical protein